MNMGIVSATLEDLSTVLERRGTLARIDRRAREKLGATGNKLLRRRLYRKRKDRREKRKRMGRPRDRDEKDTTPNDEDEDEDEKERRKRRKRRMRRNY